MNTSNNTIAQVAYLAIVIVIGLPVIVRLVGNLLRSRKIRKQLSNVPGPLLGVVYPELTKRKKK